MRQDMTAIRDFEVGEIVEGFYAALNVEERDFKDTSKGRFLSLELRDKTGEASAKWWDWGKSGLTLAEIPLGTIVKVRGRVESYREQKQVVIGKLRPALRDEYNPDDLIQTSEQSEEQIIGRISALREKISDPYILQLTNSFFDDEEIFAAYLNAAAAERNHHAFVRGLAEHSCNVTELVLSIAQHYQYLNEDLLIFGGLFHDYGKIQSYHVSTTIQYSLEGRLVDHISLADAEISARAQKIDGFPSNLLLRIRHLILSHHGIKEYGSPVEPKTPEAILLNYADLIDSRMEMVRNGRESLDTGGWAFVRPLRKNIYYGPVAVQAEEEPDE
jgi:3'-5' exoribonuclease